MTQASATAEIESNDETCRILESYLNINDLQDLCTLKCNKNTIDITVRHGDQEKTYKTPVRFGKILDQLLYFKNKKPHKTRHITFQDCTLDTHQGIFTNPEGKEISLTEKETEILIHLHEHKNHMISKEALLSAVWNYAENVETHTLETHIYRLRQKIEANPAEPKILMTEEEGYIVKN